MKRSFNYAAVVVLFLVGFFLRSYQLESLPSEMHRDEVAIGYNAYSVLKTGRDEYGVAWPLVYKSFGDYKLPGMLYAVVVSEYFFGLSPWAVRFPTAFFAALLIPVSYFLAQELWGEPRRSLLISGMVMMSQWHTFLARTAYEPMMALTLFVLALLFLLKARRSAIWYFPSLVFFFFSFMTYNVPLLIAPMIVGGSVALFKSEYLRQPKMVGLFLITLTFCIAASYLTLSSATDGKVKTTIFADEKVQNQAQLFSEGMMLGGVPYRLTQLFVSPNIFIGQAFIKNYLGAFDPGYLFFKGGINPWHSLGVLQLGNVNLFLLPLLFLTVYLLSRKKIPFDSGIWFVLFYLVISPLPDALTIDAPVTNRLLDFHFVLLLFASIGGWWLVERSRFSRMSQVAMVLIIFGTAGYYLVFWSRYATLHAKTLDPLWYEGIGQTAQLVAQQEKAVDRVYIDLNQIDAHQLTHLYFAFYSHYDPQRYQTQAVYSLDDAFSTTLSFEPYYFTDLPEKLDFGSHFDRFFPEGVETALFVVRLVNESPRTDAQVVYDNWQRKPLWQLVRLSKSDLLLNKE